MKREHIIFLDIDNTLLFPSKGRDTVKIIGEDRYISRSTIKLIKQLQKKYFIIIASGRRFSSYENLIPHITADYAIVEHGAFIYSKAGLDKEWAESIRHIIGTIKNKKGLMWDYEKILNKSIKTSSQGRYGSIRIDPRDNDSTREELNKNIRLPKDLTYVLNDKFIDILPKEATKVHAMKYLAKKLYVDWSNTFFVGDDYNDIDALKIVSHPFTYIDATPKVVEVVRKRKGYISSKSSFDAINDILLYIQNYGNNK